MSNKYAIDIDVEKILEEAKRKRAPAPEIDTNQNTINPTPSANQAQPAADPAKVLEPNQSAKAPEELSRDNKKVTTAPAESQKLEQQVKGDNKNVEQPEEEDLAANAVKKYSQYYNYNIKTIGAYLRDLVKYSKKWADFYEKNGLTNFGSKLREMQSTLGTLGGGIQGAYFDPNAGTAENIEGEEFEQVGGGAVAIPKGTTAKSTETPNVSTTPVPSAPKPARSRKPKEPNTTQAVATENPQVQQTPVGTAKQEAPIGATPAEPISTAQEPVQQTPETSQTVDPAGSTEQNTEAPSKEQPEVGQQKIENLDERLKLIEDNSVPLKQFDLLKNLMKEINASQGPIESGQSERILSIIGKNLESFSKIKKEKDLPKKHKLMQNIIDTLTSFITSRGIFVVENLDQVKSYIEKMIETLDSYKPENDVISPSEDGGKGQSYSGSLNMLKQQLEKWNPADKVIQENYNANSIRLARTIRRMIKKMV